MKAMVVTIWVFINLIFFGMCGYMYLQWSQYWLSLDHDSEPTTSTYDQQIYLYNRGYLPQDSSKSHNSSEPKSRMKHSVKGNGTVTLIKNSKPRFPNLQPKDFELDTAKYSCRQNDSVNDCDKRTSEYKENIIRELQKVFTEESNILKIGNENPYNVHYEGTKGNFMNIPPKKLLCQLKKVPMRTLRRSVVPSTHPLRGLIPKRKLFENKKFNSCAIVASAGGLKDSNLGTLIDSHDLVLRFNDAPTNGFEKDVGTKTTVRVLNSQVVTKNQFKFLTSGLYRNITLVAWDPSDYTSSIVEWLAKPDFNLFPNYMEYRKKDPTARFFLLNPHAIWDVWNFLQRNSPSRLRRNPPSSGFLGLTILLPFCSFVDMFEYVPSIRVTKRCHYYDPEENLACTFGVWHPLAAEKLLTYHVNSASDKDVFQTGFVRVTGFRNLDCNLG